MEPQTPPKAPRDEVAAALQTGRELGPDYDEAIAASLVERIDAAIEARVDAHLAGRLRGEEPKRRVSYEEQWKSPRLILGLIAMVLSIPLTAISGSLLGAEGVLLSWIGMVLLYLIAVLGLGRR
ncbi:hypothetical protein [Nocardiopsis composta]|uniref:Uncharacterized protein n=1 Tax=Nocardiopsis composta TaxID=157465 RepID=A0A7W8VD49_9ACTN|nr:hypothetical protein [Nocardiopsis composta]MBB5431559.1 hypothetical protein [Nocardiopsis composta]